MTDDDKQEILSAIADLSKRQSDSATLLSANLQLVSDQCRTLASVSMTRLDAVEKRVTLLEDERAAGVRPPSPSFTSESRESMRVMAKEAPVTNQLLEQIVDRFDGAFVTSISAPARRKAVGEMIGRALLYMMAGVVGALAAHLFR
jgi:hypothetical protein